MPTQQRKQEMRNRTRVVFRRGKTDRGSRWIVMHGGRGVAHFYGDHAELWADHFAALLRSGAMPAPRSPIAME